MECSVFSKDEAFLRMHTLFLLDIFRDIFLQMMVNDEMFLNRGYK